MPLHILHNYNTTEALYLIDLVFHLFTAENATKFSSIAKALVRPSQSLINSASKRLAMCPNNFIKHSVYGISSGNAASIPSRKSTLVSTSDSGGLVHWSPSLTLRQGCFASHLLIGSLETGMGLE